MLIFPIHGFCPPHPDIIYRNRAVGAHPCGCPRGGGFVVMVDLSVVVQGSPQG